MDSFQGAAADASPEERQQLTIPYGPNPAQHHFHRVVDEKRAKVIGYFSGIGGGKTAAGSVQAWRLSTGPRRGTTNGIIVPSYRTFYQVTMQEVRKFWPGEGALWRLKEKHNHPTLEVYTPDATTEWQVRSAQNARTAEEIRGANWHTWWGDEGGTWNAGKLAFELAMGRLRQPAPFDKSAFPQAFLTTSPRWGWLNKVFGIKGALPPTAWTTGFYSRGRTARDAFYIRSAHSKDNIHNTPGFADFLAMIYGENFARQELSGDFVAPGNAVLPGFYPEIHVVKHETAMRMLAECDRRVGAADHGFGSFAAMLAGGITWDGGVVVAREWQRSHVGNHVRMEIARRWGKQLRIREWYPDTAPSEDFNAWLGKVSGLRGVPGTRTPNKDRAGGIGTLRFLMRLETALKHPEKGEAAPASYLYISERCPLLIEALQTLYFEGVSEGGEVDESKIAPKEMTHLFDCLRYLTHSVVARGGYRLGRFRK